MKISEEDRATEPISPEFRTEIIQKFCRDCATGAVAFQLERGEYGPEDTQKIKKKWGDLMGWVLVYVSPDTTGAQRKALEAKMLENITELKTNGRIKDELNESTVEKSMSSLEARFDAMKTLQMETLLVMREVLPKLEEAIRKIDNL